MTEPSEPVRWLTVSEAAALAQVHPDTLKRWEDRGAIKATRTPGNQRRYREADILALVGAPE